jgi:hypothetical protein
MTDSTVTADREQLFATLADPATTGKFFERASDSVSWTVMGTHPLARHLYEQASIFRFHLRHIGSVDARRPRPRSAEPARCG